MGGDRGGAGTDRPEAEPPPLPLVNLEPDQSIADAGAVRNTALQFGAQLAGLVFTSVLTLYLVRALGPRAYGVYTLAVSIGALAVFPALWGLPFAIGRFLADHRHSARQVSHIFAMGLRLQVPAAVFTAFVLFALAGPIANAYGIHGLLWPLRWVALSVAGQALFGYLGSVASSLRRSSPGLWMALVESGSEAITSIALVIAGGGAAGAAFGKTVGYTLAIAAGLVLVPRTFGGRRRRPISAAPVTVGTVMRYASVMFVVDVTWAAIAQIDLILIGALLTSSALGGFGAVLKLLTVLGYVGSAVSSGVSPRLSLGGDGPDVRSFELGLRYLMIVQGLTLAPLVVWAVPITHLLLGGGYGESAAIMRALTVYSFVGAPAAMITIAVNYLGESRRRLIVMVATLALGLAATYVLIETIGVIGAAIADDLVMVAYVAAHFWICQRLVPLDLRRLALCLARTLVAAAAMAVVLLAIGTGVLSVPEWIVGIIGGVGAYVVTMLVTGELTVGELRQLATRARGIVARG
jgi:O-antigen/teichoic acid export membrane protein